MSRGTAAMLPMSRVEAHDLAVSDPMVARLTLEHVEHGVRSGGLAGCDWRATISHLRDALGRP